MADLTPITALGGTVLRHESIGALRIQEADDWALASVTARAGQAQAVSAEIRNLTGLDLPGPGGMATAGDWRALWLSPESWMLAAPLAQAPDLAATVKRTTGAAAAVTEQTDGWVRFDILAPDDARLWPLLERLCNVDPARAGPGTATRTVMEHLAVIVLRDGPGRAAVLGARSSAASLHHALVAAARSVA
ncbi:MAG: sarcosine oxidase subunit gamma [Rhodobacteraceae bacterium]|nr:sarcosine oxidase subunit gamma [Paracoccaceae bacterium]